MTPLKLFFKDNVTCEGIPTPFPTVGSGLPLALPFACKCFVGVRSVHATPDFGRFSLLTQGCGAARGAAPCSPKTSLVAHAPDGFTHDGFTDL